MRIFYEKNRKSALNCRATCLTQMRNSSRSFRVDPADHALGCEILESRHPGKRSAQRRETQAIVIMFGPQVGQQYIAKGLGEEERDWVEENRCFPYGMT